MNDSLQAALTEAQTHCGRFGCLEKQTGVKNPKADDAKLTTLAK